MENLIEDLKKGKMPSNCTLYHVSTRELRHPDPNFISAPHEGGRDFNLFCDVKDAILFGKRTGRDMLNQYRFDGQWLTEAWLNEADAVSLTNMFLIADDDYADEMRWDPERPYLADLRNCDYICGMMLTKALSGLKDQWNACEMPIEKCADLAKELPLTYIITLKTSDAFDQLKFEKCEKIQ